MAERCGKRDECDERDDGDYGGGGGDDDDGDCCKGCCWLRRRSQGAAPIAKRRATASRRYEASSSTTATAMTTATAAAMTTTTTATTTATAAAEMMTTAMSIATLPSRANGDVALHRMPTTASAPPPSPRPSSTSYATRATLPRIVITSSASSSSSPRCTNGDEPPFVTARTSRPLEEYALKTMSQIVEELRIDLLIDADRPEPQKQEFLTFFRTQKNKSKKNSTLAVCRKFRWRSLKTAVDFGCTRVGDNRQAAACIGRSAASALSGDSCRRYEPRADDNRAADRRTTIDARSCACAAAGRPFAAPNRSNRRPLASSPPLRLLVDRHRVSQGASRASCRLQPRPLRPFSADWRSCERFSIVIKRCAPARHLFARRHLHAIEWRRY